MLSCYYPVQVEILQYAAASREVSYFLSQKEPEFRRYV